MKEFSGWWGLGSSVWEVYGFEDVIVVLFTVAYIDALEVYEEGFIGDSENTIVLTFLEDISFLVLGNAFPKVIILA